VNYGNDKFHLTIYDLFATCESRDAFEANCNSLMEEVYLRPLSHISRILQQKGKIRRSQVYKREKLEAIFS
jgi:hypothetical protein